jgi:DDE superfamily endonuclease
MRVGLHGTVRRVWGRRGVKVRQRVQFKYRWRYLVLAVDGRSGRIWWNWNETMQANELIPLVRGMKDTTDLEAVVWDGAPSHRDERLPRIGLPLIALPSYSPELNPAERVFEEIRGEIEGTVYATLEEKVAAVEAILRELDADPARVQRLAGWAWVHAAFAELPAASEPDPIAA